MYMCILVKIVVKNCSVRCGWYGGKKLFLFKLSEISKIQPFENKVALNFQFVTLKVLEKWLQIIEFHNLPSTVNDPTSLFQAPR